MVWSPGDPWPGTAGGASSPRWGGYVRLYVRAAIRAGNPFTLGPHTYDRLDAGNVLAGAPSSSPTGEVERLWADLSCDVIDLEVVSGAEGGAGILTATDAGTLTVTLLDPEGKYDPTNPDSPWMLGGRSRLVPGVPVEVYAEVVDPDLAAVTTHYLFTGTADSWGEDWTPSPSKRRAKLVATDATKQWVRYNRPEQSPAGAGDTTAERVARLVAFYGWPGSIVPGTSSAVTLAPTTLAASGWELLGRTLDDELGVVYFTAQGELRWTARAEWFTTPDPVVELGCQSVETGLYDVLTDASPSSLDANVKNVIRASRVGGTLQTAQSGASIDQFGPYEYQRTDLGVETDALAGEWATDVLTVAAYPRVVLSDVTMVPGIAPTSYDLWPIVLDVEYVTDVARIVWAPPDRPTAVVEVAARIVGSSHKVSRSSWEVSWNLALADVQSGASVFTIGPHVSDRLDAGNVLAFA